MKTLSRIALCLFVVCAVSAHVATKEKAPEKAVTEITILVPEKAFEKETVLKVNGKTIDGEGGSRLYKASLEKGKAFSFKLEIAIEPNNYTKITRRKEITLKGGENVKVDMTQKQPFKENSEADDIVVRFVPTPDDIVDEMSKLAKIGKEDVVYDLGCGDAVMLVRPIMKFGAKKGVGIEYDAEVMKLAIANVKKNKLEDKVSIRQGDMLKMKADEMADATVVLLYIGDDLGERVGPYLKGNLKPGTRIVSHRFSLGDWTPNRSITVRGQDGGEYELHLWIVPERKEKKKDA